MTAQVKVWAFGLDLDDASLAELWSLLSPDEVGRADRLHFCQDRARFVAGRAQLREVLGDCLGRAPASIRFDYSDSGKPSLSSSMGTLHVHFNATHSDALGLVAVHADPDIGIDVERVRPLPDESALARRMLTNDEYSEYTSIPEDDRRVRFFEYWTRKEALAKLLGTGLQEGLDRLSLHPWPGERRHRVQIDRDGRPGAFWVSPIALPVEDYVAAVAGPVPFGAIYCTTWGSGVGAPQPT